METLNLEGLSYSAAVEKLESIVRKMESNNCSIDDLSQYTSDALQLLKFCKERLRKTDLEVQKCLNELRDTVDQSEQQF